MEKWVRSLSKTTALIIGIGALAIIVGFYIFFGGFFNGLIPMILLGAIIGGGIGFSFTFLFKGITGETPQQKKERQQANKNSQIPME